MSLPGGGAASAHVNATSSPARPCGPGALEHVTVRPARAANGAGEAAPYRQVTCNPPRGGFPGHTIETRGAVTMPEAVIVATGRTPIGRANKGSLVECRPDDLSALVLRSVLEQVPQLEPRRGGGRHPRLRPAGRRGGLQRRPRGRHPGRARQRARRHGQPLLLLLAADDPHGGPRHPRRRGRRLHRRRRRDGEPLLARRVGHRPAQRRRSPPPRSGPRSAPPP